VDAGIVATPYMVSLAFLAVVLTLSCQLAADAFLAARFAQEVKELHRDTEHLMRINAMGELASALAHELNQPLAAILSNAQAARRMLNTGTADLGEIREILDDIIRDDKRAGEIIHGPRIMLRRDRSDIETLDMREVIETVSRMLRGEALRRGAAIRLEEQTGDPWVRAGRVEIQQVALNLGLNALEALDDRPPGSRKVTISTAAEGGRVTTEVRDSGPGIPPGALETMFEPFRTTKPGGLGLGLSICRRIVESYGGRIEARNNEGGGATFGFTLPQAADSPEPGRA
jgi:C4-dicarboxylate-specific signal transduction histidine kinase